MFWFCLQIRDLRGKPGHQLWPRSAQNSRRVVTDLAKLSKSLKAMPSWDDPCQAETIHAKLNRSMRSWVDQCQAETSNAISWADQCQAEINQVKLRPGNAQLADPILAKLSRSMPCKLSRTMPSLSDQYQAEPINAKLSRSMPSWIIHVTLSLAMLS